MVFSKKAIAVSLLVAVLFTLTSVGVEGVKDLNDSRVPWYYCSTGPCNDSSACAKNCTSTGFPKGGVCTPPSGQASSSSICCCIN